VTGKKKEKEAKPDAAVICIWCYARLQSIEYHSHPCTQADFLESDKVKYAKMIHPSNNPPKQHPQWAELDDWFDQTPPWQRRDFDNDDWGVCEFCGSHGWDFDNHQCRECGGDFRLD
jgi:hypothetical protein